MSYCPAAIDSEPLRIAAHNYIKEKRLRIDTTSEMTSKSRLDCHELALACGIKMGTRRTSRINVIETCFRMKIERARIAHLPWNAPRFFAVFPTAMCRFPRCASTPIPCDFFANLRGIVPSARDQGTGRRSRKTATFLSWPDNCFSSILQPQKRYSRINQQH